MVQEDEVLEAADMVVLKAEELEALGLMMSGAAGPTAQVSGAAGPTAQMSGAAVQETLGLMVQEDEVLEAAEPVVLKPKELEAVGLMVQVNDAAELTV
ncbi:hypothetical protein SRHO_G00249200 [Serrasalmus rhombeus]